MDPKELAGLFEKKNADIAAKTAQENAQLDAQKTEREKRIAEGRAALLNVVIPYFKEIEATFPKGQFSFNPAAQIDSNDLSPVGVSFKIGDGAEHHIEVTQGNVQIWQEGVNPKGPKRPGAKVLGLSIRLVYPSTTEPFIAQPSDLTREKLGKLVEMAINKQ
jgi:hypothetical protein